MLRYRPRKLRRGAADFFPKPCLNTLPVLNKIVLIFLMLTLQQGNGINIRFT
jgi:hypothetical protein